jgi:hypothetical protein
MGMDATCETCGEPAEYDSEVCLCPECEVKAGYCPKCHQSFATHNDDGSCISLMEN